MSLDKYQQAWKAEASQVKVTFDADLLSKEIKQSHDHFRSLIFWRDVREVGVTLLTIPIWLALGIGLSLPWAWWLTVPALLWIAGFMLFDRKRHPHGPSGPGEPFLFYAKESLKQVEHQIWLLRNILWWYLLPFTIAMMAFFLNVAWSTASTWWGCSLVTAPFGLFLFYLFRWIYRLNQRAVRDQLEPRRQHLQKLVTNLESGDEGDAAEEGDLMELVSLLSASDQDVGISPGLAAWSENWNRIIPSWWIVALILVPTLLGAYCGYRFAFAQAGPVFFQSVVAAVIPFEIMFFGRWYLTSKRYIGQPLTEATTTRPRAPAIFMLCMILVISAFAFAAIFSFVSSAKSRRGPGLDDVSAFVDADVAHTDAWLEGFVDSFYPSLSAVVVRDGEIVYKGAFGLENTQSRKPATPSTPFHVASVTKVFTASLAVMMHEQGVVSLDQPASTYLPEGVRISTTPELGATITLRQLASHTSGLPRGVPGRVQSVDGRYELQPQRLYDQLANVELISDPGANEEYSNLAFGLLGHVLERASGKPIDRLLKDMVCDPLQLDHTGIQDDARLHPATGYARKSRGGGETTHSLRERLAGSGGLVTSIDDLAKFLIAQMKPGVLSREMLAELHTETQLTDGSGSGKALGWKLESLVAVGQILEKNGGRNDCNAWIGFSPEHKVAVAVVTNCGGPHVDPIGRTLLRNAIPLSLRKAPTAGGYAKVAPFTAVRWENDRPIVRVRDQWSPLVSIDGIPVDRITTFAKKQYGEKVHKRFAEDLVQVLSEMGHEPDWEVTLELERQDGQLELLKLRMTEANRSLARDYASEPE